MQRMIVSGTMGMALAALVGMNVGARAETVAYKAAMNAQSEVPTNDSKGTGTAELSYDTATKTLTWTITFSDLTSAPTVAHFHGPAEAGKNAGVAVLIGNNPTSPAKRLGHADRRASRGPRERALVRQRPHRRPSRRRNPRPSHEVSKQDAHCASPSSTDLGLPEIGPSNAQVGWGRLLDSPQDEDSP